MKCYSFFKVGGGFKVEDYANIRYHTEGKWIEWDPKRPPTEFIELGGGEQYQYERPDVWIKPCDSVVVSVKAASVSNSDQFKMGITLRFPRFKRLRMDKSWDSALSIQEFMELKARVDEESKGKDFKVDSRRRATKKIKKEMVIAGNDHVLKTAFAGPKTEIFKGLNFCILSEALKPQKKTKAELEQLVKANGGNIFQSPTATNDIICVADKKVVKAASLMKSGLTSIVRPLWILDVLAQNEADVGKPGLLLSYEVRHMFFVTPDEEEDVKQNVDEFGDSYARDVGIDELMDVFEGMGKKEGSGAKQGADEFLEQLRDHGHDLREVKGWLFKGLRIYPDFEGKSNGDDTSLGMGGKDQRIKLASNLAKFAGAEVVEDLGHENITQVVIDADSPRLGTVRKEISKRSRLPRIVTADWIEDSWKEGTLLDEERYAPVGR
jgi:DNA ligase 4